MGGGGGEKEKQSGRFVHLSVDKCGLRLRHLVIIYLVEVPLPSFHSLTAFLHIHLTGLPPLVSMPPEAIRLVADGIL